MSPIVVNNIIVKKLSLKVSLIAVNVIDYHFHLLQEMESPYLDNPNYEHGHFWTITVLLSGFLLEWTFEHVTKTSIFEEAHEVVETQ